jgi:periplasmic mercuric ion binding protein
MKNILLVAMMLIGFNTMAQDYQKVKFQVWGKCDMCQTKITKAAKSVEGVRKAQWNIATQQMMVKFDAEKTSLEVVQKAISDAGYDNDGFRADDAVYEQLHYCCKYDRPESKIEE